MASDDVVLFIDANQYLKLYEMVAAGELLDWLEEQQAHIFISAQIVDEVLRNKLGRARICFLDKLNEIDEMKAHIPNDLLGLSQDQLKEFKESLNKSRQVKNALAELANDSLHKIGLSQDNVSQRLQKLFDKAESPNHAELERARDRKERGNPPGKPKDPLGDQITWEQLLTCCKGKKQLWIITSDSDYGIDQAEKKILNPLLIRDLRITCDNKIEIHAYKNLSHGLTAFRKNVGVTANKLPTEARLEEIKNEEETFPPGQQMFDLVPVYSVPDYRRAVRAALGFDSLGFDVRGTPPVLRDLERAQKSAEPKER